MSETYCGADCSSCGYGKNAGCRGCCSSGGCPFGKPCFIAAYIRLGGQERYAAFRDELIAEFNALGIEGLPEITELFPLLGVFCNPAYPLPNGTSVKLLDDGDFYLGTQVPSEFNDGTVQRFFGLCGNPDFLMVSEFGPNGSEPVLLVYRKR